jgi:hypothetical protein
LPEEPKPPRWIVGFEGDEDGGLEGRAAGGLLAGRAVGGVEGREEKEELAGEVVRRCGARLLVAALRARCSCA